MLCTSKAQSVNNNQWPCLAGKEEYLYSAFFAPRYTQSAQEWITQFYLQTTCLPGHNQCDQRVQQTATKLDCGPMPNVMVALPNIGGALCSTPQILADTHY